MKNFIFISTLCIALGGQFLASANFATPSKAMLNKAIAQKPVVNPTKANVKKYGKKHGGHSSSSSSSSSCSSNQQHTPTFVSAVANGDANTQTVTPGNPIIFNTVMDINGLISYNPTTGVFTTFAPGSYEITFGARFYSVSCNEAPPCDAIALQINGTEVSGTDVSATLFEAEYEGLDADWATLSVIQTVTAPTTFAVIASTNNLCDLFLFNPSELCNPDITTAYITIKKL